MEGKDIFISYKTDGEGTNFAARLCSDLEKLGYCVYFNPNERQSGNFPERLRAAVESCKDFLLIVTQPCLDQLMKHDKIDWVREELLIAKCMEKNIIPLLMPGISMPKDKGDMPEDLQFLPELDSINIFEPYNKSPIELLLEYVYSKPSKNKRIFEFIPERGIMINPEDHQRNISFRTDTLINLLGVIYKNISEIAGAEEKASEIFFTSGYSSGQNFANRINNQWAYGTSIEEIKKKLNKWCNFDSMVGWGNFSIEIEYNEQSDSISGFLRISEAFMVDKTYKQKTCEFLKGYCSGVIETIIESKIIIKCIECPMCNRNKDTCIFEFVTKVEE